MIEDAVGDARRRRRRAHRRPGAGPALLGDVGRRVPRPGRRRRRRGRAAVRRHRVVGHRAGLRRRSSPPRCAASWPRCRRTPRSCSPPTRCRSGSSNRRPVPGRAAATAEAVAAAAGLAPWSQWAVAWQIGRPHTRAVAGARHPRRHRRPGGRRARRRRAGLPVRVRRRPPRGALRPRHRGPPAGRGVGPRVRPHGVDERRPAVIGALADRVVGRHDERRRVLVVGGGITGLAAAHALAGSATPGAIEIECPGGRRPPRREAPHVAVRRPAGRRRGRRRVPGPRPRRHRARRARSGSPAT